MAIAEPMTKVLIRGTSLCFLCYLWMRIAMDTIKHVFWTGQEAR